MEGRKLTRRGTWPVVDFNPFIRHRQSRLHSRSTAQPIGRPPCRFGSVTTTPTAARIPPSAESPPSAASSFTHPTQPPPPDTSDPTPGCVGVIGVKPRAATAAGGSGLTPATPTQAESVIGWDNLLDNDS